MLYVKPLSAATVTFAELRLVPVIVNEFSGVVVLIQTEPKAVSAETEIVGVEPTRPTHSEVALNGKLVSFNAEEFSTKPVIELELSAVNVDPFQRLSRTFAAVPTTSPVINV